MATDVQRIEEKNVSDTARTESWGPCLCGSAADNHETVNVESRSWPGVNKPGGVAWVKGRTVVVEDIAGESVPVALYDVKYIMGGSEKKVRGTYISCNSWDKRARRIARQDQKEKPKAFVGRDVGNRVPLKDVTSSACGKGASKQSTTKTKLSTAGEHAVANSTSSHRENMARPLVEKRMSKSNADVEKGIKRRKTQNKASKKEPPSYRTPPHEALGAPPVRHFVQQQQGSPEEKKGCPLDERYMATFTKALSASFGSIDSETTSVQTIAEHVHKESRESGSEKIVFSPTDIKDALEYLQEQENKILVEGDIVYRI